MTAVLQHVTAQHSQCTPRAAFQTDDPLVILRFATDALHAGMASALVTLTDIHGGSARPRGAQMAVREDGQYCGVVSGGCVEAAAAYEALEAIHSGRDRDVVYGQGSPYMDIVLPCGGSITLHIRLIRSAQPLLSVLTALEQRQAAGLRWHPDAPGFSAVSYALNTGRDKQTFQVGYRPLPRIMLAGRSAAADITARIAEAAGYEVHSCNGVHSASGIIDDDTAVVLLYHDLHQELPFLEAALNAAPFYIGALGSERTHQRRSESLIQRGYSPQAIARINAPIGLFPKARDAGSLALSVLADVAAARTAMLEDR